MAGQSIWFETKQSEGIFARGRKVLHLGDQPVEANFRITLTGHYRLWINGLMVGRGPASSSITTMKYDVWDVGDFLQPGSNVLAVEVIYYGYKLSSFPESPAAFWCEITLDGRTAAQSDLSWKWSLDPSYQQGGTRRNSCYGPMEVYDARNQEAWKELRYDDSGWCPSIRVDAPWTKLVQRAIPPCREYSMRPQTIVKIGEVLSQEYNPTMHGGLVNNIATYLALDYPEPQRITRMEHPEHMLAADNDCAVVTQPSPLDPNSVEQYCATIILDFGMELTGYGWIDVEGNEGAIVDVVYGERMTAGRVPPIVQSCGYADRYILKEGRQQHEVYDWKGYRYVQLTFRELTRPLKVYGVGATFTSYPVERQGSFDSEQEEINRLWQVGAYTQQLCMQDRMMDCPWREQAEWLGDGRVQLLIMQNAFGERLMSRNFLRNFAESQLEDGRIPPTSFGMQGTLMDYSLFWAVAVGDVLRFDGDRAFAAEMLPHMDRLFSCFERFANPDGLLENVPSVFIDWANVGKTGVCAPLNAIYRMSLLNAAEVAEACGQLNQASRWTAIADRIRLRFHEMFWDEDRRYYRDHIVNDRPQHHFSQHTQAMAVLAGLAEEDERELIVRAMQDQSLVQTEPYFSFYLCEALALTGAANYALNFLRIRWGQMLEQGATTFWEEWQVGGTYRDGSWLPRPRSHCHAWSAAPTAWLSRYVLGVRVERAFGPVVIEPNPCGLGEARGIVPTLYGDIHMAWHLEGDRLVGLVKTPPGTPFEIHEPFGYKGACEIHVYDH